MATLQNLTYEQITEAIQGAVQRQVPVTLTVQNGKGWLSLRSRFLALRDGHIWLEAPQQENGDLPHRFEPADKTGVSFKLKHHKHIFTGTVAGTGELPTADGQTVPVLRVCSPTRMQRMQRRAFLRADVPANRIVRASFWLGGREAEPAGTSADRPVWSGRVCNLSAGGFQALCDGQGLADLEAGDLVGVRISFGTSDETVYADAQLRHAQKEGDLYSVGFQFLGLDQTPDGRKALELIGSKGGQFQRETAISQRPRI